MAEHLESLESQIARLQGIVAHLVLRNQELRDHRTPLSRSANADQVAVTLTSSSTDHCSKYYERQMQTALSGESKRWDSQ